MKVEYIGLKSKLIQRGEKIFPIFCNSLLLNEENLMENDIIVISSKIVSLEQNRVLNIETYPLKPQSSLLKNDTELDEHFISMIISESEVIYGGVKGALLTMSNGILQANAGIDRSNIAKGLAILLPKNPSDFADEFKEDIKEKFGLRLHILIIDSSTRPLRRGTTGLALGFSKNFPAVIDERGSPDLYGNKMQITTRAIADNIATGANLVMGESNQSTPFVIVRGLSLDDEWSNKPIISEKIELEQCLYFKHFTSSPLYKKQD
ncbi:MAG: coenzyme F420-0:L-glutamate ligase [Candidatus Thorarchaeota archaeon]